MNNLAASILAAEDHPLHQELTEVRKTRREQEQEAEDDGIEDIRSTGMTSRDKGASSTIGVLQDLALLQKSLIARGAYKAWRIRELLALQSEEAFDVADEIARVQSSARRRAEVVAARLMILNGSSTDSDSSVRQNSALAALSSRQLLRIEAACARQQSYLRGLRLTYDTLCERFAATNFSSARLYSGGDEGDGENSLFLAGADRVLDFLSDKAKFISRFKREMLTGDPKLYRGLGLDHFLDTRSGQCVEKCDNALEDIAAPRAVSTEAKTADPCSIKEEAVEKPFRNWCLQCNRGFPDFLLVRHKLCVWCEQRMREERPTACPFCCIHEWYTKEQEESRILKNRMKKEKRRLVLLAACAVKTEAAVVNSSPRSVTMKKREQQQHVHHHTQHYEANHNNETRNVLYQTQSSRSTCCSSVDSSGDREAQNPNEKVFSKPHLVQEPSEKCILLFCPHQKRCAKCDIDFEHCALCNLARGDGEDVSQLAASLRPTHLFLDFDRTISSTKCGSDPLQREYVVDPALQELSNTLASSSSSNSSGSGTGSDLVPPCRLLVLTRNSHEKNIREFLQQKNFAYSDVIVAAKGARKCEVMKDIMTDQNQEGRRSTALFADDSAAEHLFNDDAITRVLFAR
ncbi:unnamed protein product [Amoebophrya sp. A25]|nr:unnamed protein product [Amoebophrya sp. A25]|eukprot:GSA25T00007790001.1